MLFSLPIAEASASTVKPCVGSAASRLTTLCSVDFVRSAAGSVPPPPKQSRCSSATSSVSAALRTSSSRRPLACSSASSSPVLAAPDADGYCSARV